jgi:hypothetical protein
MFIVPDALMRIVAEHLPFPASSRLVRTSKRMHALLQPALDERKKYVQQATASVPDALAESLFAIFTPFFRHHKATTVKKFSDGVLVQRLAYALEADNPRHGATHTVLAVKTHAQHPRVVVTLNHAATAWGAQHIYAPGSPIPDHAWYLDESPFIAAFVMDSADAGSFIIPGGDAGEYEHGIEAFLRRRARLPAK